MKPVLERGFKLDAGQVYLDKNILTEDVSGQIEEICRSLRDWSDLSLTLRRATALRLEETKVDISDPAAYANFQEVPQSQAVDFLEAYEKSRKPFLNLPGRLREEV